MRLFAQPHCLLMGATDKILHAVLWMPVPTPPPSNPPRTPFRGAGWADRLSLTPRSATEPEVVHLAERRIVEELTEWGLVPGA